MSAEPRVAHERASHGGRFLRRFDDGSAAEVVYRDMDDGGAAIMHTETPRAHRGQGVAAALVAHAVAVLRGEGRSVVPFCSFARQEFAAHPEWSEPLAKGRGA